MISIKQTNATQGFASDVHFQRTENIRSKVSECTRDELIDLVFHFFGQLESLQGEAEEFNLKLEKLLGYHETWKLK